ncbi:uncharacterized protein B0I36DRAFT_435468 [Microdochium trichocladiopsis]|uniref:Uncharacterized protein n=1 Tax=Microdochium trichocladiopsis TaxID=1682393 RepID=A0A9P8XU05_9PEZI|nr:uncharacterized protein B0I36DRAFT_435468 [Microdochium trichocladiopsis]KAH7018083.1 hypothetical protein B0I36DRAFT_435468 [Microdochium trichocladiopsis]
MADASRWTLWYDHSSVGGGGWVITVPNEHGFYITSFLSTIVTIAGASAWNIVSLLLHAHLARDGPATDVFGLQQQVSLRNSPSGIRAAVDALSLLASWRHTPGWKRIRRTALIAAPAVLVWGSFFAASLLTSLVANQATDRAIVRAKPSRCGFLVARRDDSDSGDGERVDRITFTDLITDKWSNDTINARAYALSVRTNSARNGPQRSIFMNPKLDYTFETEVPCGLPNATYCLNTVNATISLTSAKINSHADLGINAPPSDRVSFQHKAVCSVIDDGYFQTNKSGYIHYYLGPVGNFSSKGPTFRYPLGHWNSSVGYQMKASYARANSNASIMWHPRKGIARTDADQGVIFLSQNGVRYTQPVKDLFFIAERYERSTDSYKRNSFVSTMVCAEQRRWCSPSTAVETCTEWGSMEDLWKDAISLDGILGFNTAQRATAARISFTPNAVRIIDSPVSLNTAALFANTKVRFNRESSGLAENQWHQEIAGWFETMLADYQATTDEYVRKSSNLDAFKVLSPFDDVNEMITRYNFTHDMVATLQSQCDNQLIDDAVHIQNFSMVGVVIIIAFSSVLVLVSFCFVEILDWVSDLRRRGLGESSRTKIARQADEKLQLLRFAVDSSSENPKHWKLSRVTGIPVLATSGDGRDQECKVTRPTMKGDDLAMYPKNIEEVQQVADSEMSSMLTH